MTRLRPLGQLVRRAMRHHLSLKAGALTYLSLFALVPLLTLSYGVLSSLPQSGELAARAQGLLLQHLLPRSSEELQGQLAAFSQQARQLTGFGIAMLLLTGFFLLHAVEQVFDEIWGVAHTRRPWLTVLLYWLLASMGPVLLGAGLAASTWLLSLHWLAEGPVHTGIAPLLPLLPWILSLGAFTLFYRIVPSAPVSTRHALAGGLMAATLFELSKYGFGWLTAKTSYSFIYGTFSAVPLFLLWVHSAWLILLLGAEITAMLGGRGLPETPNPHA